MSDPRLKNYLFHHSFNRYQGSNVLVGPFHRKRSDSQTLDNDNAQIKSGILWGAVPQNGKCPTVQAYFGPLQQRQGIEFYTTVLPHQTGLPNDFGANWYIEDTAFTGEIERNQKTLAAITIVVVKHQP